MHITPLLPVHAPAAARLHIAGQPGTFLTSLGPEVLTLLYRALPQSPTSVGFAATQIPKSSIQDPESFPDISGFVSATESVGRLFLTMGTRHLGQLLPSLLTRLARNPTLLARSAQTALYPFLVRKQGTQPAAELLSIMVAPQLRGQGIGAHLLAALVSECQRRQIPLLDVTVDAENAGARRFYERHGFGFIRTFMLYGRPMCLYQRATADFGLGILDQNSTIEAEGDIL